MSSRNYNVKQFIKNWRHISLSNVDYKIIAKSSAARLKETLSKLILFQQTVNMKNSFISEGGRLISDILKMDESLRFKGCIVPAFFRKRIRFFKSFAYLKKY